MDKELLSSGIVYFIIAIVATIIIFLIFRALVLWYWKVNEIVRYLKEISAFTDSWACPKCGDQRFSTNIFFQC